MEIKFDPTRHKRRSIRLPRYDYSSKGVYFITICTHQHLCIFGDIIDGQMQLNAAGRKVQIYWSDIPEHFPQVSLDEFVVMPNHVHGILFMKDAPVGGEKFFAPTTISAATGNIENRWLRDSRFQDRRNQMGTEEHDDPKCLATQLLGTHHPQRTGIERSARIHSQQSEAMDAGPVVSCAVATNFIPCPSRKGEKFFAPTSCRGIELT